MNKLNRFPRVALSAALLLSAGGLTLGVATPVASAAVMAEPTTAEEVMDRAIEAAWGDWAKNRPDTTRRMTGSMEIPMAGLTAQMTITFKSPDMVHMAIDIPGMGSQTRGTNGEMFWETSTMQGPRIIEGEEKTQMAREADFYSELDYKNNFKDMKLVGKDEVDGQQAYVVTMVPVEGGAEQKRYYSVDTGLLIRMDAVQVSPMGEVPVVTRMSDYREVDGLKLPFTTQIEAVGMTQILRFEKIEQGIEIDDALFEAPAEVKELVEDEG